MAITANRIVKRQGRDGKLGKLGVAASTHIYEGQLCYVDGDGYLVGVVADEDTVFAGIAREEYDNSSGADGDIVAEFWTDGDFVLPMDTTSLVQADIGKTLYGVDNEDVSETATSQPPVGLLLEVLSTSLAVCAIRGLGNGIVQPGASAG